MATKYTALVEEYCEANAIEIPVGFYRHNASHLVIIRYDLDQPKLVAKTFFNKSDLNYYLEKVEIANDQIEEIAKILDLKNKKEYIVGKNRILTEL